MNTGFFQFLCAVFGAEVGIDDVQVSDTDLFVFFCQMQGIVYGNVGLAAAVMAGK